jgi:chromosome segregation ATPase
MMKSHRTLTALTVLLGVAAGPVYAQAARSGGGGGDAQKIIQQMQQVAQERSAAQAEATKSKAALDEANKALAAVKAERDALRAKLAGGDAAAAQAEAREKRVADELEQTKGKLTDLVGKYRELATNLREVETSRATMREELASTVRSYDSCVEHNVEVIKIAREALDRYAGTSASSSLLQKEPFTRLSKTRAENLALEYQQKLEELTVRRTKNASGSAP